MLFVKHIDSIIQIVLGCVLTGIAYRRPSWLGLGATRFFKICGPSLILIGAILCLKPSVDPRWERQFTSDQVASAEFPGTPTPKESTDTMGSVSVKRSGFVYNLPGKDIALFLSWSALPEDALAMTEQERIESLVAALISQGAEVLENEKDPDRPIYRLTISQDKNRAVTRMVLAYVNGNVYRVVAASTEGRDEQALIERFLKSFQIS